MKKLPGLVAALAVLLVMAFAGTTPTAHAKGPTDVAVSGPGVDADLGWTRRTGDVDLGTLMVAARIVRHWDGSGLGPAPSLTADQLGPRYLLTWTVAGADWAVQHAYPFAKGGAWVRFGTGGWVKAPALTKQLVALGAAVEPVAPAVTTVQPAAAPASPQADREDSSTAYDVAVPAGGLLAAALLVGGVLIIRRRPSAGDAGTDRGPAGYS